MFSEYDKKKKLELLNLKKRNKNYITLPISIRPKTKESITNEEIEKFLNNMFRHMKIFGWKQFKNYVAIELMITTNNKNTPHIHHFIKNIIDLLYESDFIEKKNITYVGNKEYFPIKDDDQIKYLKVKYLSKEETPTGIIRIRLFSSMISDINFILKKSLLVEKENYDNNLQEYFDWLEKKDLMTETYSEKAFHSTNSLNLFDAQKQLLKNTKISCQLLNLIYKNRIYTTEVRDALHGYSKYIIDSPYSCVLKKIPSRDTSIKKFKEEIEESFKQFIKKNYIFKELMGPINITAFYKPIYFSKSEQKDLDNIMRKCVCPIFNKCFNPPISFFKLKNTNYHKSLNNSVLSYEILEIPKYFDEINNGFLSICFNMIDYSNDKSIFDTTDELIEAYFENESV